MNPLTLGLLAAALTVVIVKVVRGGRARSLGLPMDARYSTGAQAEPAPEGAPRQSSSAERTGSSATDLGQVVQAALRNYGNKQLAARGATGTAADTFMSSRAMNDGIIGPVTRQIWDQVREQYNNVLRRGFLGPLLGTSTGLRIESLQWYLDRGATGRQMLFRHAANLGQLADNPAYWNVVHNYL